MTSKEIYIQNIEGLYPIDSEFSETNEIGKKLLLEAIEESGFNWRDLPEDILRVYSEKCVSKCERDERKILR